MQFIDYVGYVHVNHLTKKNKKQKIKCGKKESSTLCNIVQVNF